MGFKKIVLILALDVKVAENLSKTNSSINCAEINVMKRHVEKYILWFYKHKKMNNYTIMTIHYSLDFNIDNHLN